MFAKEDESSERTGHRNEGGREGREGGREGDGISEEGLFFRSRVRRVRRGGSPG